MNDVHYVLRVAYIIYESTVIILGVFKGTVFGIMYTGTADDTNYVYVIKF